jgi:hypothetical protein
VLKNLQDIFAEWQYLKKTRAGSAFIAKKERLFFLIVNSNTIHAAFLSRYLRSATLVIPITVFNSNRLRIKKHTSRPFSANA